MMNILTFQRAKQDNGIAEFSIIFYNYSVRCPNNHFHTERNQFLILPKKPSTGGDGGATGSCAVTRQVLKLCVYTFLGYIKNVLDMFPLSKNDVMVLLHDNEVL